MLTSTDRLPDTRMLIDAGLRHQRQPASTHDFGQTAAHSVHSLRSAAAGAPVSSPHLLTLQRTLGNRAVSRMIANRSKLTITGHDNLPGTHVPGTRLPLRCSCGGTCDTCSGKESVSVAQPAQVDPSRKWLEGADDEEALLGAAAPSADPSAAPPPDPSATSSVADTPLTEDQPSREEEREGLPHAGSATIVCDGAGGYRPQLNSWAGAPCGIEDCVRRHEQSHATDWLGRWPDGCRGKTDGAAIPLGGAGYDAFLRQSECRAYTVEVPCEEAALAAATGDCRGRVQTVLTDTRAQKTSYCGA